VAGLRQPDLWSYDGKYRISGRFPLTFHNYPHNAMNSKTRRLPIGAEVMPGGGVHFRVWAPRRRKVEVVLEGGPGSDRDGRPLAISLDSENNGYFSGYAENAGDGTLYRFRLGAGGQRLYPDPASRMQPEGTEGPSEVVDPALFRWTDHAWSGPALEGQVIYEMHPGTFTPEGTWQSACQQLAELAAIGITVIEIMPVAESPGAFGWGYDGVLIFAPNHSYGTPDDFRRFVNSAHGVGLAVILDVVYNHLGPQDNYLPAFTKDYFSKVHSTDWGDALNFDGANSGPVREYYIANAGYWVEEFHLDGLRLDATQDIYDSSPKHILADVCEQVRRKAHPRKTLIVGENEPQRVQLVKPVEEGGYGLDVLWNDDFHHTARVALTGRKQAYYTDYLGSPQELISAVKWGYLYQGQRYIWQKKRRGTPTFGLRAANFVNFLENHDQLANSSFGQRVHEMTSPGRHRALTALLLLAPGTPMLFQGQEFSASSPFLYFADFEGDLARSVRKGRAQFLKQFKNLASPEAQKALSNPSDLETFRRCKLDFSEREKNASAYALHRDLLNLRRSDPVFRSQRADRMHGAVLSEQAWLLRFFGEESGDDRLLLVNLGRDMELKPAPEPLIAPPEGTDWLIVWSSEYPSYGGSGVLPFNGIEEVRLSGESALVLKPRSLEGTHGKPR
jgi:maltooligosyltrehalose trehalohydrolase